MTEKQGNSYKRQDFSKRKRTVMVITSEEEEGQRKVKIKGFNDRMEIETFDYDHFLLSGDCIKIQGDGGKVVCSKDDSWRMDRHRNMP